MRKQQELLNFLLPHGEVLYIIMKKIDLIKAYQE